MPPTLQPALLPGHHHAGQILAQLHPSLAPIFLAQTANLPTSPGELNRNGAPLEFAINPTTRDLRLTTELPGPPAQRLRTLSNIPSHFHTLQAGTPLRWGAWRATRLPFTAPHTLTHKTYAEVHPTADPTAILARHLPQIPPGKLVMLATSTHREEFYFDLHQTLTLTLLTALLRPLGLAHRTYDLAGALTHFDFRRGRAHNELPQAHFGFSISVPDPIFSLFLPASQLAGGDPWIRTRFLDLHPNANPATVFYERLTRPLVSQPFEARFHNMLAITVDSAAPPTFQLSLCPPPERIDSCQPPQASP